MLSGTEQREKSANRLTFHDLRKFLTLKQIQDIIRELPDSEAYKLRYDYDFWARPTQRLPDGNWRVWFLKGGRGSGKTWTGANVVKNWARDNPRMLLVGRTAADVRDSMIEGDSDILSVSPKQWRPTYEPSKRRLTWPNGAIALLRSADEPDSMRGPNIYKVWADDAKAVETINRYLDGKALRPPKYGNRRLLTAKLSEVAHQGLQDIAQQHGYVYGDRGNVSMLLEAIGTGTLTVTPTDLVPRYRE